MGFGFFFKFKYYNYPPNGGFFGVLGFFQLKLKLKTEKKRVVLHEVRKQRVIVEKPGTPPGLGGTLRRSCTARLAYKK